MDKCEIEINEGSKMKQELEDDSVQTLETHLGKLLVFLQFLGIPITEGGKGSKQGYLLGLLQKVCFPIFILLSAVFLLYSTLSPGEFGYWVVIDTFAPILPIVLWLMMRCQTTSLKIFFADLGRLTSRNFKSQNRRLSYTTNAAICFVFVYPLLLVAMRFAQDNIVNEFEVFRILQEGIFPVTMAVVYASVCCLLVQKLRSCKKMFQKLDLTSSTATSVMKDYLSVVKGVDKFEQLLSNVTFVLLVQNFLVISIIVIDIFYMKNWVTNLMIEALCELAYVFTSLVVMSWCAGNVTTEMEEIKSVVLEKAFTHLDQGDVTTNEKHTEILLKKDSRVLTLGKAIVFNRGFVFKLLLAVFVEVVLVCEILPVLNR